MQGEVGGRAAVWGCLTLVPREVLAPGPGFWPRLERSWHCWGSRWPSQLYQPNSPEHSPGWQIWGGRSPGKLKKGAPGWYPHIKLALRGECQRLGRSVSGAACTLSVSSAFLLGLGPILSQQQTPPRAEMWVVGPGGPASLCRTFPS